MVKLAHPNVLPLLGCCVVSDLDIRLVMPFMANGSLGDHLGSLNREKYALRIANGIAHGMEYLHKCNVVHRDLKPENVLLGENFEVRIADFALSRTSQSLTINVVGTPAYMSPELIQSGKASCASDVYSFGVMLYELLSGERVFEQLNALVIMHKVANEGLRPAFAGAFVASKPEWIPDSILALVGECLAAQEERPTFKQICDRFKEASIF